ncbi:hypothetical protein GCK32_002376 [Trichostrongylus colubriformis]|uniref:BPTI/Kunitz inhibitor domain-containing protein n=1 Tax=Trichostrongylus colubriformis TaxID=6319 RepID=A0AAN8IJE3_TRICO
MQRENGVTAQIQGPEKKYQIHASEREKIDTTFVEERYYFDYETAACLAFEYYGCGGNANNYRTSADCFSNCMFADQSGCAGMYPAARLSNGRSLTCPAMMLPPGPEAAPPAGPKLNEEGCPSGYVCRMGAFFGTCCNQANEDLFGAAYRPKCDNGREPYSVQMDGWRQILFGKTCRDKFCPSGRKCQDADIFAYCC